MNKAAIDIGSNTILLLIMDENHQTLEFEARVTSLGKNLDKNKCFEEISMKLSFEALSEFSEICSKHKIDFSNVIITATEASRVATNAKDFYQEIYNQLGANVTIISGEQEAFYSAYGVVKGEGIIKAQKLTLMDIGGGSTELIFVQTHPFQILKAISLPLGSVRVSDWIEAGTWEQKQTHFMDNYNFKEFECEDLIGVAGTMTSLINIANENEGEFQFLDFQKSKISTKSLNAKMIHFKHFSSNDFLEKFPYLGKRSAAIWGGYQVCRFICEQLKPDAIQVSFKGLVHGVLLNSENES